LREAAAARTEFIVVPPGYHIGLTVRGKEYDGTAAVVTLAAYPMHGVDPFAHTNPEDRPMDVFGGTNTLHLTRGDPNSYRLLPLTPESNGRLSCRFH